MAANIHFLMNIQVQVVELCVEYLELLQHLITEKKRFRRWWSKPIIRYNYLTGYNGFASIFKYFQLNDEEEFINFTRMNVQTFEYLYQLVRERLTKRSRRPPLPSELRLGLTIK